MHLLVVLRGLYFVLLLLLVTSFYLACCINRSSCVARPHARRNLVVIKDFGLINKHTILWIYVYAA